MTTRRGFAPVASTIVVTLALLGAMVGGGHAETTSPERPPLIHLTRFDAWYGLAAVAAVGGAGLADDWFRERAAASGGTAARRLARAVRPLGAPEVLGPALLLGYLGGRALDRPGLTAATVRMGAAVVIASAAAEGLKIAVGRVRPIDIAGETDHFKPFSGHDSFPSGHATLAFASATALDRETGAGWVPWVAYPLAGLVGWSRVRDDLHWTSDVVAGAALGYWVARKTEDAFRVRAERSGRMGILLGPTRLGACVAF
jgi:membrane-associated phospholipid phosphatase